MVAEFVESQAHRPEPEIGSLVAGRYRLLELVGRGGMGAVYRAEHILMGRVVALKMLLEDLSAESQSFKRFHQEARVASTLEHPNIVAIHDFGLLSGDQAYLAMDYIAGRSLDEVLNQDGLISVDRSQHIFAQACDAFEHAHQQGMVHRDIKPNNLMLLEKGGDPDFLKIVDFGLVKLMGWAEADQKLTSSQTLVGSPLYMSPEQCRGLDLDHRSDIYSLGCVMYRALSGAPPVVGETALDTLYKHVSVEPLPFSVSSPSILIPARLESVIRKALEKRPEDRQQSMAQLKEEILSAIQNPPEISAQAISEALSVTRLLSTNLSRPTSLITPAISAASASRPPARPPVGSSPRMSRPIIWSWLGPALVVLAVGGFAIGSFVREPTKLLPNKDRLPALVSKQTQDMVPAALPNSPSKLVDSAAAPGPSSALKPVEKAVPATIERAAVSTLLTIKQAAPDRSPKQLLQEADLLQRAADQSYVQKDWSNARSAYEKALSVRAKIDGVGIAELLPLVSRLTVCCRRTNDMQATAVYFNRFSELFARNPAAIQNDAKLLSSLAEISAVMRNSAMTERIVTCALSSKVNNNIPQDPALTGPVLSLALAKALQGESDTAETYFKWALALSEGKSQLNFLSRNQYATFLRKAGRFDEASKIGPIRNGRNRQNKRFFLDPDNH